MVVNRLTTIFLVSTLCVLEAAAHKGHHHGHGSNLHLPHGLPQLPQLPGHTHTHSTGQTHTHVAQSTHTHPLALPRTRFVISKLWNGSDDTVSQASDKGGNQVFVTLEGKKVTFHLLFGNEIIFHSLFLE